MRMDGYIRVSRVGGRDTDSERYITEDVQRQQIARWAELRGVEIVGWHKDRDQTGGKMDRPGLNDAIERIKNGETSGIVVARWDRFARSLDGALRTITELDAVGGELVSVAEGIDPTTPGGRFQRGIFLLLAEFRREELRESWAIAQERAVARGVHIASRTPTGYLRDEDGRLLPHPQSGSVIAEVFRRRAGGASWRELARFLDERGVVGPYEAERWTSRAVEHMVRNRVYLGEARSGRFKNGDAHKPLVDRATWEAAQLVRGAPAQRSNQPALLAGLLRCAGCRYLMRPDKMTIKTGPRAGERVRTYRCRREHAAGECESRAAVLGTVIEPLVEDRLLRLAGRLTGTASKHTGELEDAEREAGQADAELAAYRDNERILDALGEDRFVEGLEARARRADAAHARVGELRSQTAALGLPGEASVEDLWPELETPEKQKLLQALFDAVFIRSGRNLPIADRVRFFERGTAPTDLPRRGHRVPLAPLSWPAD